MQGGNTLELYKALALVTSQLLVQSSWMLIGNQSFSQAFSSALHARYFLVRFLWDDLLPPVEQCSNTLSALRNPQGTLP